MTVGRKPGMSLDTFVNKAKEAKAGDAIVLSGKSKLKTSEQKGSLGGKECVVKKGDVKKNQASVDKFIEVLSKTHGDGAAARAMTILGNDRDAGRPLTGAKIDAVMTAVKADNRAEIDAYIGEIRTGDKEYGGHKARLAESYLRGARESGAKLTPEIKREVESLVNRELTNIRASNRAILEGALGKVQGGEEKLAALTTPPANKWIGDVGEGGKLNAHMNVDLRRAMMDEQIGAKANQLLDAGTGKVDTPKTGGKPEVKTGGKPEVKTGGKPEPSLVGKELEDLSEDELQSLLDQNEKLLDDGLKDAATPQQSLDLLKAMVPLKMLQALLSGSIKEFLVLMLQEAIDRRMQTVKEVLDAPGVKDTGGDKKPEVTVGGKGPGKQPEVGETKGTNGTDGSPKSGKPDKVSADMYESPLGNPRPNPADQLGKDMWKMEGGKPILNIPNAQCKQLPGSNTCFIMSVMNGLTKSPEGRAYLASLVTQTPEGMVVRFPGDPQGGNLVGKSILVTPEDVARHRLASGGSDTRPAVLVALECAAGSYLRQTYDADMDFDDQGIYQYGMIGEAEAVARGLGLVPDDSVRTSDPQSLMALVNGVGGGTSMMFLRQHNHFVSVSGKGRPGRKTASYTDPSVEKEIRDLSQIESSTIRETRRKEFEAVRQGMRDGVTVDLEVFDSLSPTPVSTYNVSMRDTFDCYEREPGGAIKKETVTLPDGRTKVVLQMKPDYVQFFKFDLPKS